MAQPFQNYKQQINKLKIDKQLRIDDEQYAENMLKHIGYYALISGYKDLFKDKQTSQYLSDAKFEDIVALYRFDETLRELFLRYIMKIERHLLSLLSYYFTEVYGENQSYYLDKNNYNYCRANQAGIDKLVGMLDNLANNTSDYAYINHNRNAYANVPLWVLINAFTFGMLSKFYDYSQHAIQSKVSHEFPALNEHKIRKILPLLTKYRNVCAHGERLFSYRTHTSIPDLKLHRKLHIPKINGHYIYGKQDLFAVVISFKYFLEHDDFIIFKRQLSIAIKLLLKDTSVITESHLYSMMGFPQNWKQISRIKNI